MAPLLPILITLALSLVCPLAAHSYGDDDTGYGSANYYAEQNRQHERQMESYRQEEQAAQYRTQQDTARMNEPTQYSGPSWTPSTHQFNLYQGNDTQGQLCTATKTMVSCY